MDCARRHSLGASITAACTKPDEAGPPDRPELAVAACVDGGLWFYGNLSRNRYSGTHVAILAAFSCFSSAFASCPRSLPPAARAEPSRRSRLDFLVLDPEQLFDASFQLTFLAVAFLGAFATPLIQATSGPFTRSLHDINETRRDLRLEPRAAQFRVEMRLLAETLCLATRLPARWRTWPSLFQPAYFSTLTTSP